MAQFSKNLYSNKIINYFITEVFIQIITHVFELEISTLNKIVFIISMFVNIERQIIIERVCPVCNCVIPDEANEWVGNEHISIDIA